MQQLHISTITIPPRARKTFDPEKISELAASLESNGQIQPIVVRSGPGGPQLVAGHRRMLATKLLEAKGSHIRGLDPGYILAVDLGELSELEAKTLELEENLCRENMTWKEIAMATAEIHQLKSSQDPNWTEAQTAEFYNDLTGSSHKAYVIKRRLVLAQNLHRPSVAKATSEDQALKALTVELEREMQAHLVGEETPASSHVVEWGDSRELIPQHIREPIVDMILTDPPYGLDAESFNIDTVATHHFYNDSWDTIFPVVQEVLRLSTAVCKPQAFLYMFCEFRRFAHWEQFLSSLGWKVWPRPLIWAKNGGYAPLPNKGPRYFYECILFANLGERSVLKMLGDVLAYPIPKERRHAAQKPDELFIDLITRSVPPGSVVLDPFCGSGTTLRAALTAKCRAICFDKDPSAIAITKESLR